MLNQGETQKRRKLKVDLPELEFAFEDASGGASYYLDLETGQVVMITGEIRRELEDLYEEAYNGEEGEPIALADILQRHDLPEWMREALQEADQVEVGYGTRYISVPRADSHEGYRDVQAFISTVRDERLQDRL